MTPTELRRRAEVEEMGDGCPASAWELETAKILRRCGDRIEQLEAELAKRVAVKLPERRYFKDRRGRGDDFPGHSEGWDDALDACEKAIRAAGCAIEGEENPACVINEASSRVCLLGTKSCVVKHPENKE